MLLDQRQVLCAVGVTATDLDLSGQDAVERATIDQARWWHPDELGSSGEPTGEGLLRWVRAAATSVPPSGWSID